MSLFDSDVDYSSVLQQVERQVEHLREQLERAEEVRQWALDGMASSSSNGSTQTEDVPRRRPMRPKSRGRGRPPTLRVWIMRVLRRADEPLTTAEIRDQAEKMGWTTDSDNKTPMVRNALIKLLDDEKVERVGETQYRLVTDPEED